MTLEQFQRKLKQVIDCNPGIQDRTIVFDGPHGPIELKNVYYDGMNDLVTVCPYTLPDL